MDNAQTPTRPMAEVFASPYLPGFLQGSALILVGAFLAGHYGLAAKLEPLLLDPKTSGLLLFVWALSMFATMLRGVIANHKADPRWSSLWVPIQATLTASALLPISEGLSPLVHALVWAMRLGVGA